MRNRSFSCVAVLVAAAAWVQACGGSGGDEGAALLDTGVDGSAPPAPTATTPTPTPAPADADVDTGAASDGGSDASSDAATEAGRTLDGGACDGGQATVSKVTPLFGYAGAATPATITGSGFSSGSRVYLVDAARNTYALTNVAFVSSTSLTGTVPAGLAAGAYDIAVVTPDECASFLAGAFTVVANPVPLVLSVSPAQGTTQADVPVTVTGCNFPANAKLATVSEAGAVVEQTAAVPTAGANDARCGGGPLYTMTGTIAVKTKALVEGVYLVRVSNPTDGTYGEYASFVVQNPSGNLVGGWKAGPSLVTARRALGLTNARLDDANRFLYAIGGETAAGAPLASVEVAQVDRFGKLGGWVTQKNALKSARSGLAVARRGLYLYAIGGTDSTNGTAGANATDPSGTPLASVERAKLLEPSGAPKLADPTSSVASGALAKGTYYYRVAAVLDGTDPATQGETLPSELVVASLGATGKVDLTWTAPAKGTVSSYRIYRSPAGAPAGSEVLLDDQIAGTSYSDTGAKVPGNEKPMALGSTGPWVSVSALGHARLDTAATIAPDPNGALYLYVVGGFGKCGLVGSAAAMTCYEAAPLSDDGATLGPFADGAAALARGRLRHGLDAMTALNGPPSFAANAGASAAFVVVGGGKGNATSAQTAEYARVLVGGVLAPWASPTGFANERDGSQLLIANGYGYALQGGQAANAYAATASQSVQATVTTTTLTFPSWSNAAANLAAKLARHGAAAESAYFYIAGGTTDDADALANVWQVLH